MSILKLNSHQLRHNSAPESNHIIPRQPIYVILDNILDTYNVGAIFRLADAQAIQKIYLAGQTEAPPNPRIKKASVNTWQWVPWEKVSSASLAITYLKRTVPDIKIIAIEQTPTSRPYQTYNYSLPIALVVGHETKGVSPATLKKVDACVELPMLGINTSLNVMVSLGIVLYRLLDHRERN